MEVGGSSQIWVLGTQFRSSTRAVNALNCWSTSPAPTVAILLGVRRWISVALVLRSPMVGDFEHLHLLAGSLCVFSGRISAPVLSPLSTVCCWGGGSLQRGSVLAPSDALQCLPVSQVTVRSIAQLLCPRLSFVLQLLGPMLCVLHPRHNCQIQTHEALPTFHLGNRRVSWL